MNNTYSMINRHVYMYVWIIYNLHLVTVFIYFIVFSVLQQGGI